MKEGSGDGGGGGGGGGGGDGGFVRADQIDLKSLDEQLERHLSRAWTMEKRKEEASAGAAGAAGRQHSLRPRREDWEIDPAKLVVKGVIARGTFGTVHRGIYDGHDVAGTVQATLTSRACPRGNRRAQLPMRRRLWPLFAYPRRLLCCLFWQIAGVDAAAFSRGFPWCSALLPP
jgi:hypothetical protein